MLVIEIINTREVMRKRIGRLGDHLVGRVLDHEEAVEKAVIQELETAFKSFGIEANILSVKGLELMGNRLEVPLKLREQRQVIP
ncbi:MAG: cytochrome C oxidase [Candidatus Synechococcus spongiarum 142]|uniref:Cytochrome C oxidase n=1 Tax=Candidatus Synechococcus spongiarum 142 TaxID=1608213 RepID=A0A6N3X1I0_9SYNE|nr:MAG: cytochrome C oxidase [Candidatus Synechococcus spongiarum 142]